VQRLSRTIVLAHIRQQLKGEELDQPYTAPEWLSGTSGVSVEQQ